MYLHRIYVRKHLQGDLALHHLNNLEGFRVEEQAVIYCGYCGIEWANIQRFQFFLGILLVLPFFLTCSFIL